MLFLYRLNATKLDISLSQKEKKPQTPHKQLLPLSIQTATDNPEMAHSPGHTRLKTFLQTYDKGGENC